MTHWTNPWTDAIPCTLDDLLDCVEGIGETWGDGKGGRFVMTRERMLAHWRQNGTTLDPYVLRGPADWHNIGIRYGNDGPEYLSPHANQAKTAALIQRLTGAKP